MKSNKSDQELIELYIRKNDQRAISFLMERYGDRLFSYLIRKISSKQQAEDLYQETWLKVIKSLPNYKEEGKFVNYLFFIATNCAYDYLRHLQKENANIHHDIVNGDEDNKPSLIENIADHEINQEEFLINEEKSELINQIIGELPVEQQEIVNLRCEGFTFQEITEMTNTPINTLLSRMRYAVKKIQSKLLL